MTSDQDYIGTLADRDHRAAYDAKDYEYQLIDRTTITVLVNGEWQAVKGFNGKYNHSGSTESYRLDGYLLSDGAYARFVASCDTQDLDEARQALSAISVRL